MTPILVVIGIVVFVVTVSAVRGYRGADPNAPPTQVCVDCGHRCHDITAHRDGWTFLFFPFNVLAPKHLRCPACKGKLIDIDSPRGKQLSN